MLTSPAAVSRVRARAVNSDAFRALSPDERDCIRAGLSSEPDEWTAEVKRYVLTANLTD